MPTAPAAEPGRFRSLPVEIDAMQWTGSNPFGLMRWREQFDGTSRWRFDGDFLYIDTLEGEMKANPGDWIIRGTRGEFYPCKPDVFLVKYKRIGDTNVE